MVELRSFSRVENFKKKESTDVSFPLVSASFFPQEVFFLSIFV